MGRIIRPAQNPYLLQKRIKEIRDEQRREEISAQLDKHFDHNRKSHVLRDRTDDLTLTEGLLISDIIGCTPAQLADNTFDFNHQEA